MLGIDAVLQSLLYMPVIRSDNGIHEKLIHLLGMMLLMASRMKPDSPGLETDKPAEGRLTNADQQ